MIELIPCYKSPEVLQPTNGPFDFPSFAVSPELSAILSGRFNAVGFVRSNQVDSAFEKSKTQRIAVRSLIVNQYFWSTSYDTFGEQRLDEFDFMKIDEQS